jgi:hypothetical protein
MYYLVTVGYESEQTDRAGNPRIQKEKYAVEAESVEEATLVSNKYINGDSRGGEILSVTKLAIECVIDQKNTPEYYKA